LRSALQAAAAATPVAKSAGEQQDYGHDEDYREHVITSRSPAQCLVYGLLLLAGHGVDGLVDALAADEYL